MSSGCLSPIVGYIEARRMYGRRRVVILWDAGKPGTFEVWLDIEGVDSLCRAAGKNKGHSARRGPVSVRRTACGRRR